jgi:hypothetical protein
MRERVGDCGRSYVCREEEPALEGFEEWLAAEAWNRIDDAMTAK